MAQSLADLAPPSRPFTPSLALSFSMAQDPSGAWQGPSPETPQPAAREAEGSARGAAAEVGSTPQGSPLLSPLSRIRRVAQRLNSQTGWQHVDQDLFVRACIRVAAAIEVRILVTRLGPFGPFPSFHVKVTFALAHWIRSPCHVNLIYFEI